MKHKLLLLTIPLWALALPSYGQILSPIFFGKSGGGGGGAACTPASGYSHCRMLTLDHLQVPSTQTNFPVAVAATLGSSRLQNAACFDLIFTSDSSGSTKIPWEIESCNQGTGAIVAWVLVASLSSSSDTKVYVHYQNASISTAQNTGGNAPTAVWDSNFKAVWHNNTTSGADSTSNAVNLTNHGAAATTGVIGGAVQYTIAGPNYQDGSTTPTGSTADNFTLSAWVYPTNNTTDLQDAIYSGGPSTGFGIAIRSNGDWHIDMLNVTLFDTGAAVTVNAWQYLVLQRVSGTSTLYVNNVAAPSTTTATPNPFCCGNYMSIGGEANGLNYFYDGRVDEVRTSQSVRSADWMTCEYNNQKPSSTFVSVGSEI